MAREASVTLNECFRRLKSLLTEVASLIRKEDKGKYPSTSLEVVAPQEETPTPFLSVLPPQVFSDKFINVLKKISSRQRRQIPIRVVPTPVGALTPISFILTNSFINNFITACNFNFV